MKKENKKDNDKGAGPDSPESHSRRKVIKKAAYIAPTIIVLGVLSPIEAVALPSPPPPPESPLSPLYQPQNEPEKK